MDTISFSDNHVYWSGNYVKDTQDLLTAIGTLTKFSIIHEDKANEFFYDLMKEFEAEENISEDEESIEFSKNNLGTLYEYVEIVDEHTAKKIAETLRDRISNFIWRR